MSRLKENPMNRFATLVLLAFGCTLAHAADRAQSPQAKRMSQCQQEATASGKKGAERKEVLRACLTAGKASGKSAKG
jgi:hypothetical protein